MGEDMLVALRVTGKCSLWCKQINNGMGSYQQIWYLVTQQTAVIFVLIPLPLLKLRAFYSNL